MEDNKKNQLSEDELEQAAGGIGSANECWFKPKSYSMNYATKTGFGIAMECTAGCFGFGKQCRCHGTNNCINRLHIITVEEGVPGPTGGVLTHDAYPAPKSEANHSIIHMRMESYPK